MVRERGVRPLCAAIAAGMQVKPSTSQQLAEQSRRMPHASTEVFPIRTRAGSQPPPTIHLQSLQQCVHSGSAPPARLYGIPFDRIDHRDIPYMWAIRPVDHTAQPNIQARSLFSQCQTPTAPRRAVGFFRSGCPSSTSTISGDEAHYVK
jgi:hypothetical protein